MHGVPGPPERMRTARRKTVTLPADDLRRLDEALGAFTDEAGELPGVRLMRESLERRRAQLERPLPVYDLGWIKVFACPCCGREVWQRPELWRGRCAWCGPAPVGLSESLGILPGGFFASLLTREPVDEKSPPERPEGGPVGGEE